MPCRCHSLGQQLSQSQALSGRVAFRHEQPKHAFRPQCPHTERRSHTAVDPTRQSNDHTLASQLSQDMVLDRVDDLIGLRHHIETQIVQCETQVQ